MIAAFKRTSYLGIAASVALLTACSGNLTQNPSENSAVATPATSAPVAALPTPAPSSVSDSEFVNAAAQIEAGRYALGVLGAKKAQSSSLRRLAHAMSADAAASSRWLLDYAREHHLPTKVSPKTRAMYQYSQMSGMTGGAFDAAFARAVLTDSTLSLDRFEAAASGAHDAALRAFAKGALAHLQSDARLAGAK